jgi:Rnl2 family RNA ligase
VLFRSYAEGAVLKPIQPKFFGNGKRVILKQKIEKFSEVFKPRERNVVIINPKVEELMLECIPYVTVNRLRNVISHIGSVTEKDFGKLSGLLVKDVIIELEKTHQLDLEKDDDKCFKKELNKFCNGLIREHFVNIIDGMF